MESHRIRECIEQQKTYVEAFGYAGHDPYDALNSPVLARISDRSKLARIVCTQCLRRSPVNLRAVLGIPKGHNPKAIGLFLWGYVKLYLLDKALAHLERIDELLALLETLRSTGHSGNCWGYNFDWQSRTVFRPKWTPTVVNSSFIGHALLDCFERIGVQRALDMAVPIADFILNDLNRTTLDGTFCFSYTPLDTEVVHNANLLGASLLIRLAKYRGDREAETAALASLQFSMRHQRPDGSWYYADTPLQKWVDSFHTGFTLQAVRYFLRAGVAVEYEAAYRKGVQYYADHFFMRDGTPKYYNDRVYPIDIHAPAQAIYFFCGEGQPYRALTDAVVQWTLENMYSGRGFFYFRKGRFLTNRIPYMRWSQAWLFHALTEYLLNHRPEDV
jgi:rhamnogalacturonyl hydrolase YesR